MKTLQHPRGTTSENDQLKGAESQLTVDMNRWELRLHDKETPGGHRILNLNQLLQIFMQLDSEFGDVAFDPGERGFLVRTGDREWTLRILQAADGIDILEPAGENDDPTIGLDLDYLLGNLIAGRAYYAGATSGTGGAFQVTVPESWQDVDGGFFACQLHTDALDDATLQVTTDAAQPPLPIKTISGSTTISGVVGQDSIILFMKAENAYYMVGIQDLQEIPDPEDPPAGQGALGGLAFYGALGGSQSGSISQTTVNLAEGETVIAVINYSVSVHAGEGGAITIPRTIVALFAKMNSEHYVGVLGGTQGASGGATNPPAPPEPTLTYNANAYYSMPVALTPLGASFTYAFSPIQTFQVTGKGQVYDPSA